MTYPLWRLDSAHTEMVVAHDHLAQGLALHIAHTPLISTLMQIGALQQAYVSMAGCDGCTLGRCVPGCYRDLFTRLLHACGATATMQLARGGLAPRPYQRFVFACPTPHSDPPTRWLLAPWAEARLILQWRGRAHQVLAAALLAVGEAGPDPACLFRAAAWQTWMLPPLLGARLTQRMLTTPCPLLRPYPHAPTLLWPMAAGAEAEHHSADLVVTSLERPLLTAPASSSGDAG